MKVLVTTPNGKVGNEVVKQLLAAGHTVRAGVHNLAKEEDLKALGAEVAHFDFADAGSVQRAVQGIEALYLANPTTTPTDEVKRVVDLAKAAGVRRVVKLSAMGIEQSDNSLRQQEQHIEASGLEWTFLRPNWFFQNYSTSQQGSIRQGAFYEPAAEARTSFIDTRDVAAVAVEALTQPGHHAQGYTLTGPQAVDRKQIAAAISKATGKQVQYVPISDEQFKQTMIPLLGVEYTEILSWLYDGIRQGWTEPVSDTFEHLVGREPIGLEQFAKDHKEDWL